MTAPLAVTQWARECLPRLNGRCAVVTGGAGGIGLGTARGLAALGARVVVADVDDARGTAAVDGIRTELPAARVEFRRIDLASPDGVVAFAAAWGDAPLDLLVNNAGILPPLQRRTTREGFELSFAISVLGHFALTARLLPALSRASAARVVWLSSLVHRRARLRLDDLHGEEDYDPQAAYNQAKLACLMLALEMQQRARAAGSRIASSAAHPGVARTGLAASRDGQRRASLRDHLTDIALAGIMRLRGQPVDVAARSILLAAADPSASGGSFIGPARLGETGGTPGPLQPAAPARDAALRAALWRAVEDMTGQAFDWRERGTNID